MSGRSASSISSQVRGVCFSTVGGDVRLMEDRTDYTIEDGKGGEIHVNVSCFVYQRSLL